MTDTVSKKVRSRIMKSIRSNRTKLEEKVSSELWKRGYRFRRNVNNLFGTPDIAIKKYRVVIFIDSCFWHGCKDHCRMPKSNKEFWVEKIEKNKRRDKEVTDYYRQNGWFILRIWEHDLVNDFQGSINRIGEIITQARVYWDSRIT